LRQAEGADVLTPLREGRIEDARQQVRRALQGKSLPAPIWPQRAMVMMGG
jgi:hypothetical protein